ncbi:lantibiotic dehydratase [Actinomadura bangladeshensis]|uniref:lantibiotic dehydratase n=1 Tax=Actinomadura bangladeshensis TaxID=453573 RepID=UPI001EF374FA|nr:lantibiotic dehydratase [Actinomadura bangladeshensis]
MEQVWARTDVREAVELASPALASEVDRVLADHVPARRLRRTVMSLASYMLRWEGRATPFGLFAGVTTAGIGPAVAKIGTAHQPVVRADAEWIAGLVERLEQDEALPGQLTVMTDNAGIVRDGRFIVSRRAELGARSPGAMREASVGLTTPIKYALEQAATPIELDALVERVSRRFSGVGANQVQRLLHGLVGGGFLITSLRPPSTALDPLEYLVRMHRTLPTLATAGDEEAGNRKLGEVSAFQDQLAAISTQIAQHNTATDQSQTASLRAAVTTRMRALQPGTDHVLAADLRLNAHISLPSHVLEETERAADVLLRVSAQPFGTAAWMDYHSRFRARYGLGALVPVRELLADSGLGYPHGYLGAPRARPAWRMLTERDAVLLSLIQEAAMARAEEIALTDADLRPLEVGDQADAVVPRRVELGVALHAVSAEAIDRGDFELRVVAAPRAHTSMIGRFAHLLDESDRARLAGSYTDDDAIVALLSFPPRRPHNDNVVRVAPHSGTAVLPLSEHADATVSDQRVIRLADLAVTADADQMYLVQRSTRRRVIAHLPHALDTSVQTPPLARFLAEVADARSAVFGPLDLGAARTLPYVPRIRYRRTVLSGARWLLTSDHVTGVGDEWETGIRRWRDRWRVPARVVACQGELRLPLDLNKPLDRHLLRSRLERTEHIELREDTPPDALGWIGRPTELVIPMVAISPSRPLPVTAAPSLVRQPGDAELLRAHLVGNPARFDAVLTGHLPALVEQLGGSVRRWWIRRHRDLIRLEAEQYLVLLFRLTDSSQYGTVAARLAAFTTDLRGRGLVGQLMLTPATEHPGHYGDGPAMEAAENVFAADTAAAIAQIGLADSSGISGQAIAAASMAHLAAAFAPDPLSGYRALTNCLKQGAGRLDPGSRDHALRLGDAVGGFAAVRALPGGDAVASAWQARSSAAAAYCRVLRGQCDPVEPLKTLLHEHHVRALGLDPAHEAATGRLARAVALRNLATAQASDGPQ